MRRFDDADSRRLIALSTALAAALWAAPVAAQMFEPAAEVDLATPSGASDYAPTLTEDELYMVFTRDPGASGNADLYETRRATTSSPWSTPTPIVELNGSADDTDPCLAYKPAYPNVAELLFVSNRTGRYLLYKSMRTSPTGPWSAPVYVTSVNAEAIARGWQIRSPCEASDGFELLFAAFDATGRSDIYSALGSGLYWGTPSVFGPGTVSLPGSTELYPAPIGITLPLGGSKTGAVLFASSRSGGAGSFDLYMAYRTAFRGSWSVFPLADLNTSGLESSGFWMGHTGTVYFGSATPAPADSRIKTACYSCTRAWIPCCEYVFDCFVPHPSGDFWNSFIWLIDVDTYQRIRVEAWEPCTSAYYLFMSPNRSPVGVSIPGLRCEFMLSPSGLVLAGAALRPPVGHVDFGFHIPCELAGQSPLFFQVGSLCGASGTGSFSDVGEIRFGGSCPAERR